ncbi:MAG: hypothetical protein FH756_07615 [Firmicutes bacterium]|nr:hypothetical protein [Bacillota bacterium]
MAVMSQEQFTDVFNKEWLEKEAFIVQLGMDDGEVFRATVISHAIQTTTGVKGEIKKAFVQEGLSTDRQFLHITATNLETKKDTQTHLLIELDESAVYDGRPNNMVIITDRELVSFMRPQQ